MNESEYKKFKTIFTQGSSANASSASYAELKAKVDTVTSKLYSKKKDEYLKKNLKDIALKADQERIATESKNIRKSTEDAAMWLVTRADNTFKASFAAFMKKVAGARAYKASVKQFPRTAAKMNEYIEEKKDPLAIYDLLRGSIQCGEGNDLVNALMTLAELANIISIKNLLGQKYAYVLVVFVFSLSNGNEHFAEIQFQPPQGHSPLQHFHYEMSRAIGWPELVMAIEKYLRK